MLLTTSMLLAAASVQAVPVTTPETPAASAQTSMEVTVPKPQFKPINHEEDYSGLRDGRDANWWTKLKYIPVGDNIYASVGGELRLRGEYRGGERYGLIPQDADGDFQMRARLWGDLQMGGVVRAFVDLEHGQSWGLDSIVSPLDQGKVDFHQAFVEANIPVGEGRITARVGRQEIGIGSFSQFDMREGANLRRSHDAARIMGKFGSWDGGVLAGYSLAENAGTFNDKRNKGFKYQGVHLGHTIGAPKRSLRLEALLVASDRAGAAFDARPLGHDDRRTLSLRALAVNEGLSLDVERVQQWGENGALDIAANFTTATLAHSWSTGWKPRIALRMDRASGDKNPLDGKAGTYLPLFPRPMTYNGDLGYQNLTVVQPMLTIMPTARLKVDTSVAGLWRTRKDDGVYSLGGPVVFRAEDGDDRYFGTRLILSAAYALNAHTTLGYYSNYTKVTDDLTNGKDMAYFAGYMTFRF